jgi:hypothetical protein
MKEATYGTESISLERNTWKKFDYRQRTLEYLKGKTCVLSNAAFLGRSNNI